VQSGVKKLPDYVQLSAKVKLSIKHQYVKKYVIPEVFYRESMLNLRDSCYKHAGMASYS
jgi:hypothetical protein